MLSTRLKYVLLVMAALLIVVLGVGAFALPDPSKPVTLPEHTAVQVTLDQAVTSNQNRPGDHFAATVSEPVIIDGKTVIPQGANVDGLVVDAKPSGRLMGRAHLQLALQSVEVNGQSYEVRTLSKPRIGKGHTKHNLLWIGGGAGGGAVIGALAGGGTGALIGGPIGAGAGTTVALLTGKRDIKLRPETRVTFRLAEPVAIPVKS